MAPAAQPIEADPVGGSLPSGEMVEKGLVGLFYPQRQQIRQVKIFRSFNQTVHYIFCCCVLRGKPGWPQMPHGQLKLIVFKIDLRPAPAAVCPSLRTLTSSSGCWAKILSHPRLFFLPSASSLRPSFPVSNSLRNPVAFLFTIDPESGHFT